MKKIIVKPLNILLSLLIILLITSCNQREKDYVTKFIYFKYSNVSLDSTNNPQIDIKQYLEYDYNTTIQIATGGFNVLKIAPKFDLCNFYNVTPTDSFKEILNNAFCDIVYGNSCKKRLEVFFRIDMPCYFRNISFGSFFIVETNENKRIKMFFDPDSLTTELKPLYNYIKYIFDKKTYKKTNRFEVDNAVELIQQELFFYCPPPPPPPPEALEQKVKFTAQIKIKEDTIIIKVKDTLKGDIEITSDSLQ